MIEQSLLDYEKQIVGEIWTSTEVYANVERLCDCGSRFAGTDGARLARDLIKDRMISYGLEQVRFAPFEFLAWQRGEASLHMTAPRALRLHSASSLVYSPNTSGEGLCAEVVDMGMGTKPEFEAKCDDVPGRIVLVSSASPRGERSVHRREKYARAVAHGARGFIFANHLPGMLAPTGSLREGQVAEIPAVGLSYEDSFMIRRLLKENGSAELLLRVSNSTAEAQCHHVVGEVPGLNSDEVLVVGAHYDGHDVSQGAVDDAAGTAEVLELGRVFAPLAGKLRRTIRFETYAAEELGVLGSSMYVKAMSDAEIAPVCFMLNLDGGALRRERGLLLQGLPELRTLFSRLAEDMAYPLELSDMVQPASDHFPYFLRGVPAAHFFAYRPPESGRGFGHTAADTLDKVDQVELRESTMVAARLLLRLADHQGSLGRKRSPSEIETILRDADWEERLRIMGKWPF